jgi:phosphatidylinositol glycan class W
MIGRQPFICNFRAYVLVATAVSILAVDFHIFPRRFAKAETYGTGIMDVGVGAFVVSNAIVSPEATRDVSKKSASLLSLVVKSLRSSSPLLVLGLLRCLAVKSTDYQEHVSEYGVHWNFFITLFIVRVKRYSYSMMLFLLFSSSFFTLHVNPSLLSFLSLSQL